MDTATAQQTLQVRFGASSTTCSSLEGGAGWRLDLASPLLDGQGEEVLFEHPEGQVGGRGRFHVIETERALAGFAALPYSGAPEEAAQTLYRDLLECIVLHTFEGKAPFSGDTRDVIDKLKSVYGCDLTASDSHMLTEESG